MLNALLNAFPPDFISNRANEFADMIKDCEESVMPKVSYQNVVVVVVVVVVVFYCLLCCSIYCMLPWVTQWFSRTLQLKIS